MSTPVADVCIICLAVTCIIQTIWLTRIERKIDKWNR